MPNPALLVWMLSSLLLALFRSHEKLSTAIVQSSPEILNLRVMRFTVSFADLKVLLYLVQRLLRVFQKLFNLRVRSIKLEG